MIAATTSQVGVFPDVANLPLRPPAVMAKAAATIGSLAAVDSSWASARAASGTRSRHTAARGAPRRGARRPARGDRGHPHCLERRAQPALRGRALPPGRRPLRPGAGTSDRHLARACTVPSARGWPASGRRLGSVLPLARSTDRRDGRPPRRGGRRGGARPGSSAGSWT